MIYPNQADNDRKEIIRVLSLYHCLELRQLIGLFPSIPVPSLLSLLRRLQKQGRILLQDDAVKCLPEKEPVDCMSKAIDVLLDFFPEVTYHSPGEFPVTLTFLPGRRAMRLSACRKEKNSWLSTPFPCSTSRWMVVSAWLSWPIKGNWIKPAVCRTLRPSAWYRTDRFSI